MRDKIETIGKSRDEHGYPAPEKGLAAVLVAIIKALPLPQQAEIKAALNEMEQEQ